MTANRSTVPPVTDEPFEFPEDVMRDAPVPHQPRAHEVTPFAEFVTGQNTRHAANVFMWKRAGFVVVLFCLLPAMLITCLLFPPLILAWAAGLVWFIVHNVRANRRSHPPVQ